MAPMAALMSSSDASNHFFQNSHSRGSSRSTTRMSRALMTFLGGTPLPVALIAVSLKYPRKSVLQSGITLRLPRGRVAESVACLCVHMQPARGRHRVGGFGEAAGRDLYYRSRANCW